MFQKWLLLILVVCIIEAIRAKSSSRLPPNVIALQRRKPDSQAQRTSFRSKRTGGTEEEADILGLEGGMRSDFSIPVSIGTPPRNFSLAIDTRTPFLSVPDAECTNCVSPEFERYNTSTSTSSSRQECTPQCFFCAHNHTQCGASVWYSEDRQIKGFVYRDYIYVAGVKVQSEFVSFYQATPGFTSPPVDGVLGLAYESVSTSNIRTLFSALVANRLVSEDEFSLCLGPYGGYMTFGAVTHNNFFSDPPVWTPLQQQTQYVVRIFAIRIGQLTISARSDAYNPTILDTTSKHVLLLPSSTWDQFYDLFIKKYCSSTTPLVGACNPDASQNIWEGNCFDFSQAELEQYPNISVVFDPVGDLPVQLSLRPADYLVEDETGLRCLDILPHTRPAIGGAVLGARWMQKYYTVFDRANKRVGFSPAFNCTGARYQLELVSGDRQRGTVSTRLNRPLVVRVRSLADGKPVSGIEVEFKLVKGKGHLSPPGPHVTDENGKVEVQLTLGELPSPNMVIASLNLALGSPLLVSATAEKSILYLVFGVLSLLTITVALILVYVLQKRIERERHYQAIPFETLHVNGTSNGDDEDSREAHSPDSQTNLLDVAKSSAEKIFFSLEPIHSSDVIKEDMYKTS